MPIRKRFKMMARVASTFLIVLFSTGCDIEDYLLYLDVTLYPSPGAPSWQQIGVEGFRKGVAVNTMGGNLMVQRTDLSVDTLFGTQTVTRTFNSADFSWRWNFDLFYDGETLIDETGAILDVKEVAAWSQIPGTRWIKVDDRRIKTLGGLTHEFHSWSNGSRTKGQLDRVYWGEDQRIRLEYNWISGPSSICSMIAPDHQPQARLELVQCTDTAGCADTVMRLCFDAPDGLPVAAIDRADTVVKYTHDEESGFLSAVEKAGQPRDTYTALLDGSPTYGNINAANRVANGMRVKNAEGEVVEFEFEVLGRWANSPARRIQSIDYGANSIYKFSYNYDPAALLGSTIDVHERSGLTAAIVHVANYVTLTDHTTTIRYPNNVGRRYTWKENKHLQSVKGMGRDDSFVFSDDPRFENLLESITDSSGIVSSWERTFVGNKLQVTEKIAGVVQRKSRFMPFSQNIYDNRDPNSPLLEKMWDGQNKQMVSNTWNWGEFPYEPNTLEDGTPIGDPGDVARCFSGRGMTFNSTDAMGNERGRTYGVLATDTEGLWQIGENATGDIRSSARAAMGVWGFEWAESSNREIQFQGWHGHLVLKAFGWLSGCGFGPHAGFQYDELGNRTEHQAYLGKIDSESPDAGPDTGGVERWEYDVDRNRTKIVLTSSQCGDNKIDLSYRSDGRMLRVDRPCGSYVKMRYDAQGLPDQKTDYEDGQTHLTTFTHDRLGRLVLVDRPNGASVTTDFNSRGLVSSKIFAAGDDSTESTTLSYVYNASNQLNRLRGTVTSNGTDTTYQEDYEYDDLGRREKTIYNDGSSQTTDFDYRNRVEKLAWSGNKNFSVGYSYDDMNRQTEMRYNGTIITTNEFQNRRLRERTFANGLVRTFAYDTDPVFSPIPSYQLTLMKTVNSAGEEMEFTEANVESVFHTTSAFSRLRLSGANPSDGGNGHGEWQEPDGDSAYWEYVSVKQLDNFRPALPSRRVGFYDKEYFSFDSRSNTDAIWDYSTAEGQGEKKSFTYSDDGTRLHSAPVDSDSIDYEYDAGGAVTRRDGRDLKYNGYGQLTRWGEGANAKLAIEYDAFARPIWRIFVPDEGPVEAKFWCAGGTIECDSSGNWKSLDLGGVILDLTGANDHTYRHQDWRGHIMFLSDKDGQIVTAYGYSAYGTTQVVGQNIDREQRWVRGAQFDELMLIGSRVYDTTATRFLSKDPVFNPINEYSYTLGNPVEFWDPTGASPQAHSGGIGNSFNAAQTGINPNDKPARIAGNNDGPVDPPGEIEEIVVTGSRTDNSFFGVASLSRMGSAAMGAARGFYALRVAGPVGAMTVHAILGAKAISDEEYLTAAAHLTAGAGYALMSTYHPKLAVVGFCMAAPVEAYYAGKALHSELSQ